MQKSSLKGYPLSLQQKRLWMLQGEGQAQYTQCAIWLHGDLDVASLLQALQRLVSRHDILRTAFHHMPGMEIPVQAVTDQMEIHCPVIDVTHLALLDPSAYLDEYMASLQKTITDMEAHPLLAVALLSFSSEKHLFLLCLPALCTDEYTLIRMVSELGQLYDAPLNRSEWDEEPLQYAEVADWQEQLQLADEAEPLRAYWHKINLSQLETIRLPFMQQQSLLTAGTREEGSAFTLHTHTVVLEHELIRQIRQQTQQSASSLEAWFLACWEIVLWRLNGMQTSLLGVTCNGRNYEGLTDELSSALGPLARVVPLEIQPGRDTPFAQVVRATNTSLLEAEKWQFYFSWEDPALNAASLPHFFPLGFEYVKWPQVVASTHVDFSLFKSECTTEKTFLKLSVAQIGEQVQLRFQFDVARISAHSVEKLASVFQTLLQSGSAQPQASVNTLALLAPDVQESLLSLGSAPPQPVPSRRLHQLFERQAQMRPDYLAVIDGQIQLTYRQLNEQANQLARVLRQRGVGPGVVVGLCLPRQASMLVGLLAILKAGGAYLPLDAGNPPQRLTHQLQESQVTLLLTQEMVCPPLPEWKGSSLCLETLSAELAQASCENQPTRNEGEDLAYIIYTSGSTGLPKGVMIRQSSVVNYTLALCEQLKAEPGWHYATVSTLAADLGNTAIFCALASGGCVQVLDYERVTSGEAMARWAEQHPIDVLKIVPSHLSALLESEHARVLLPRRALVLGGEALSPQLVERVQQIGGRCQIYNHYGPTETAIGVLVNQLEPLRAPTTQMSNVPLGRPIANTQLYVLDQQMQLLPAGMVGELYIGGAGVALGYQQQAAQTAQHFVPNPYSQRAGERIYRTGDFVYYGEDGKLVFVGRNDGQVKLRGYRIELGEIENALRQHPLVWDCTVQFQEHEPGAPQLVGYVAARTSVGLTAQTLREELKKKFPDYMIPTGFVMLKALPLTPNGKLDRQQLLPLALTQENAATSQGEPRSVVEELLLLMWKDLLSVSAIGVNDNFFALGGHSLLATRVIARLRALFQVELSIQMLFETPTIAELASQIEQILRQGAGIALPPPLQASARPEAIPLSYAQQRLWFLEQLEPDSTAYLLPSALHIQGTVMVQALRRSVDSLIARHESLRTTFADQGTGEPAQIIQPAASVHLPVIDLQGLPQERRIEQARHLIRQEAQRACDLIRGPLLRISLVRLEPEEHVLLLTLHHIITDGWSNSVFVRELTSLYRAYCAGEPSPLASLSIQYADYALWQRQWLQGQVLEIQLDYWHQQLAGNEPLALPTDHPRPAVQSYQGATQEWQIPPELTERLRTLSQQQHVTLFMTLLASFQILLLRYSGQRDISVGTPIANRRHAEIEEVIGFFVNTLVLRTDLAGNPSFVEVLQRVREVCLEAYAHQDVPFEQVVEALQPERDLSRTPLFQVMFVLQNAPQAEQTEVAGVQLRPLNAESITSKFDLTLAIAETPQGLSCSLEYSTALFESETIGRMLSHWQNLLEGVLSSPHLPIGELPLLSGEEQDRILSQWNATQRAYPQAMCIHQLFALQAAQTPDAVAVVFEDEQITYAVLDERSTQLMHSLHAAGVTIDSPVGVYLERSCDQLITFLAILKAEGAYVPLDPSYPAERLAFILADTGAQFVVSRSALAAHLPEQHIHILCLDHCADEQSASIPLPAPGSGRSPAQLAYIMYTSGSTGQPKGIAIPHMAVVRLLFNSNYIALGTQDCVGWAADAAFDAATFEIWGALLHGGRLVIIAREEVLDPHPFTRLLYQQRITTLFLTTALFNQLAQAVPHAFAHMKQLLFGGEAVDVQWVATVLKHGAPQRLLHVYGPTESTTFATWYPIHQVAKHAVTLPIGTPLSNTTCYILDQSLHPVPIGVAGELYLGGDGLARGYWRQPALTAERFVPDPWSLRPGARLYRTGDLARFLPDGSIEYVGRVDRQVKIRGYRIELGEIEAAIRSHPAVLDAVVLAREDLRGDRSGARYLAAYVVATEKHSVQAMREFLREKLPAYMIPAFFVPLDVLPLNANGKVDRRALPDPERSRENSETAFVAPRTRLETVLTTVWSQVLGVEQVGIHDNFFAMGGDSILSIQVVRRAKQAGLHITPRHIFQYQSIAQLATVVTPAGVSQAQQSLVTGPVPLTPIQHWFFDRHLPVPHHFHQGLVLQTQQALLPTWVEQALRHLLLHHDALRLRFVHNVEAENWQAELAGPPSHPFFYYIDLAALPAATQRETMATLIEEAQTSIDLASGQLLRALFFVCGGESADHLFLLIHHLAVDSVSWRILAEDLETLCRQQAQQIPLHLEDKTTSWQQWAQQLHHYAQTPAIQNTSDYWLAPRRRTVPPLPEDLPGGINTIVSSEVISVSLSAEQTQALLRDVPPVYHTQINEVLLTALVQAFALWTGQSRLLLDLEGHGREEIADETIDLSRTVGWFTTIYPLLLEIEPQMEPGTALKAVKEQMRQIPHRGFSYGLRRYLSNDPAYHVDDANIPRAQVLFNNFGQMEATAYEHTMFLPAPISAGSLHSEQEPRSHLLDITGQIVGGTLRVAWRYSRHIHRRETIQQLAQSFIANLQTLIAHCQARDVSEHTPSDFPLAALNQLQLDTLTRQLVLSSQDRVQPQIEDIYPLSPMQAGLLFHSLYAPASPVYCVYLNWTLQGSFHAEAWQWAWQQVVNRHPILRTAFIWQGLDEPVQVVCTQVTVPWRIYDWRAFSDQERRQQIEALRQQEEHTGFDLQVAPLVRLSLIRLEEDRYEIHFAMHHLLLDGWSQALIIGEVQAYYQAFSQGKTLALPSARPYRDYIAWLQQQNMTQAELFWQRYLQGFTEPTRLAIDRQPYGNRSQANRIVAVTQRILPQEITVALQDIGKQYRLTLNTILQGVWALLLSRYSGETDVLFGATVAGRPTDLSGIETMVGLFINTLPVRVRIEHESSLVSWLAQLQEQQAEVRHYEYTPLVAIQQWSELANKQTLFESLLLFQNYPLDPMSEEAESEISIQGQRSVEYTNYPLTLKGAVTDTFILQLAYEQNRFDTLTIERLMDQLQLVLETIARQPRQRLADIPALTSAERDTMLVQWNATQSSDAPDCPIQTLVERQAVRTPDAVALVCEESCVTYEYMLMAAQRVATCLQSRNLPAGATIGLCVERSLEQVIGILGILQAGGAYVPLDPSYPRDRLVFMLEDSQAAALLTQPWSGAIFAELATPQLWLNEAIHADRAPTTPMRQTSPKQVAYLIYTSGSTGKPKGTMIPHRAVGNFFASMSKRPGMQAQDHVLAVTSFSFDIAVLELLLPLTVGARVHIASQPVLADGTALAALLETSGATLVQATPSTWRMLLSADWKGQAGLKILCGGEALSGELARELRQAGLTLWNMYGPTETTIWSAIEEVRDVEGQVAIGGPIENTRLYVLDSIGSLVPPGGVGELYIAGEGIAYGYWQRPDLSAERFLPDPFTQEPGGRMYRTGDRVRWLENGTLAYLGRMDQQIKLRGHRIELNEIAAVLREHPGVQDAVVVMREESEVHAYLAAYVVARTESKPTYQELQQHLQKRLPDYMLPTVLVELEALPLTPNGKVDRHALPVPDLGQQDQNDVYIAPETELQAQLAAIWTELLGIPRISIQQNFFALGGNSLLATRLMVRLRSTFPVEVPLQMLFETPTIARLALVIEQLQDELIDQMESEELERLLESQE
ncbi:MAG TPA: amino acid adenylation domain-containing protein [Ktedonobacteraceae bacterium]|nr:amino acid adenylation domain-containing protein [Ktedonobacteraceae bacterium]